MAFLLKSLYSVIRSLYGSADTPVFVFFGLKYTVNPSLMKFQCVLGDLTENSQKWPTFGNQFDDRTQSSVAFGPKSTTLLSIYGQFWRKKIFWVLKQFTLFAGHYYDTGRHNLLNRAGS